MHALALRGERATVLRCRHDGLFRQHRHIFAIGTLGTLGNLKPGRENARVQCRRCLDRGWDGMCCCVWSRPCGICMRRHHRACRWRGTSAVPSTVPSVTIDRVVAVCHLSCVWSCEIGPGHSRMQWHVPVLRHLNPTSVSSPARAGDPSDGLFVDIGQKPICIGTGIVCDGFSVICCVEMRGSRLALHRADRLWTCPWPVVSTCVL
jgi:hypothetical protein